MSDRAAEHAHMTMITRSENSSADHIVHVHLILLVFCHVRRNINP
jgi:hypothetical protein